MSLECKNCGCKIFRKVTPKKYSRQIVIDLECASCVNVTTTIKYILDPDYKISSKEDYIPIQVMLDDKDAPRMYK